MNPNQLNDDHILFRFLGRILLGAVELYMDGSFDMCHHFP